jgi:DNA-binding MarR family transcriptional regulator
MIMNPPDSPLSSAAMAARTTSTPAGCGVLFFRLARASGEGLGDALSELGMRPAEYAVLNQLAEAGPLSQQALARALRIHPSNLVGLIDELEGAELVLRRRDPEDRRRYLLELTARGGRRLGQAERATVEAERELLSPLSRAERERLRELLSRLAVHSCAPRDSCGGKR